jgi:hypothetical protein
MDNAQEAQPRVRTRTLRLSPPHLEERRVSDASRTIEAALGSSTHWKETFQIAIFAS